MDVAVPLDLATRALAPLIDNALRHSVRRVTLRAVSRGDLVELLVSDDGPDFAPAEPEDLFAPGYRHPASPGAGLGLPLARRLARAAGGQVDLRHTRPTTFVLTLPRARAHAPGSREMTGDRRTAG